MKKEILSLLFMFAFLISTSQTIYSEKSGVRESVTDRFIRYSQTETTSDPYSNKCPSSANQSEFAKMLGKELIEVGLLKVKIDSNAFVYATIPSNMNNEVPTIGLIAHLDTDPGFSGKNVRPLIRKNYTGDPIILLNNIRISPEEFPELKQYIGQDIITADGTTLLGADDKAGIAEIISAMEFLLENKEIPHGKISICFTPDEEISKDIDRFNIKEFGADFAFTVDGTELGEIKYENFNGAKATINISGKSFHTGYAKNKLVNASLIGHEFITMLPPSEKPENTEDHEGFFHLLSFNGNVEKAELQYWIRDFNLNSFEKRKEFMVEAVNLLNIKYGHDVLKIEIKDEFFNMIEKIKPLSYIIELAEKSMTAAGIMPKVVPIRGGSTGARLTFKGLPCPNIFTGVLNMHSPYEYISTKSMEKAVEVIVNICKFGSEINIRK